MQVKVAKNRKDDLGSHKNQFREKKTIWDQKI